MSGRSFTVVLHTDGLYYVADRAKDDFESVGFRTLEEAAHHLHLYEREEEEEDD